MKLAIKVRFDPPQLAGRLRTFPARARRVLDLMIEDLARGAVLDAKKEAPYQTGALRRSIQPKRLRMGHWKVVAGEPYAPYMEFGTRPHWPPQGPILEWVLRTPWRFGISPGDEKAAKQIAYRVRRAIARRGIKERGYMRAAFKRVAERAPKLARIYAERLARELFE